MIERHTDATFFNRVLNDCVVRPDVADAAEGEIDVSLYVANPENVLLCGEHGGFLYFRRMPGVYEVHTAVLPSGRGRWALDAARASLGLMFTKTPAYEVLTRIPAEHGGAKRLAQACGLRYEFTGEPGCVWRGRRQPAEIWGIRLQDWVLVDPDIGSIGRQFHEKLNAAAVGAGITDAPHDGDDTHDIFVGAAIAMIIGGQAAKACNLYNRWALLARHPIVHLISHEPVEIAMDIGVLRFRGNGEFDLVRPS